MSASSWKYRHNSFARFFGSLISMTFSDRFFSSETWLYILEWLRTTCYRRSGKIFHKFFKLLWTFCHRYLFAARTQTYISQSKEVDRLGNSIKIVCTWYFCVHFTLSLSLSLVLLLICNGLYIYLFTLDFFDLLNFRFGKIDDGTLEFVN